MIGHNSPRPPKVIVPRQISETKRPVRPNSLYFIAIWSCYLRAGDLVARERSTMVAGSDGGPAHGDYRLSSRRLGARLVFQKYVGELDSYFAGSLDSSLRNSVCVSGRENIG
jgi:hypothetical protein